MTLPFKDFVEGQLDNGSGGESSSGGALPVKGVIPDMFSDSERYIQLQNVYREQADADAEEVMRGVRRHLEAVGRPAVSERKESS